MCTMDTYLIQDALFLLAIYLKMTAKYPAIIDISVDNAVFGFDGESLKVLLIEQDAEAFDLPKDKARHALPGDLVLPDESLHESARRVLKELTSLEGIYLKQFFSFGNPDRVNSALDQEWLGSFRQHPERRVVTVAYYSLVKMDEYIPQASSFAARANWTSLDEIPQLAFDHNEILESAVATLREELISKNIGFELLPEKFTLSQLQSLYELILDKKLDKRNFRKNIKKMEQVVPLDEKQTGVLHKPAQLFKFEREE